VGPPWEWPWSSARAHTLDAAQDALLDSGWQEYLGGWDFVEWKEMLSAGMKEREVEAVRLATRTGEPRRGSFWNRWSAELASVCGYGSGGGRNL